jgi:broad specificity phosphatase PhoE
MLKSFPVFLLIMSITGCSNKYFIVRHAEKAAAPAGAMMSSGNNPELSAIGKERAEALKKRLAGEKIRAVYSTNTIRTISTAAPVANQSGLQVQLYSIVDSNFISLLKGLRKNTLIVAHSNTVDDLVNGLTGKQLVSDLPENIYDNLFIVVKKGNRLTLVNEKYGQPSIQ